MSVSSSTSDGDGQPLTNSDRGHMHMESYEMSHLPPSNPIYQTSHLPNGDGRQPPANSNDTKPMDMEISSSSEQELHHITPGDSRTRDMSRLTASGAGDAVDQPNNVYSSIPEAQITHQQYKAAHDQAADEMPYDIIPETKGPHPPGINLAGVKMEARNNLYSGLEGEDLMHTGDGGNAAYELIPARKPHPSGITMEDNVLYHATASGSDHRSHKTLTMSSQLQHQLKESPEPDIYNYIKGEWSMGGAACRKACVVLVVLVLCVMLVVALISGVLALIITFTRSNTNTNDQSIIIMELTSRIQALEMSPRTDCVEGVATLNVFQNCSTCVEGTCAIAADGAAGPGNCTTDPVPINKPGEIILNMNCLRTMETEEVNPLIATLEIFNGIAKCLCAVPTNGKRQHDVECGLQVTRCITPQNINYSLMTN